MTEALIRNRIAQLEAAIPVLSGWADRLGLEAEERVMLFDPIVELLGVLRCHLIAIEAAQTFRKPGPELN